MWHVRSICWSPKLNILQRCDYTVKIVIAQIIIVKLILYDVSFFNYLIWLVEKRYKRQNRNKMPIYRSLPVQSKQLNTPKWKPLFKNIKHIHVKYLHLFTFAKLGLYYAVFTCAKHMRSGQLKKIILVTFLETNLRYP